MLLPNLRKQLQEVRQTFSEEKVSEWRLMLLGLPQVSGTCYKRRALCTSKQKVGANPLYVLSDAAALQ